MSSPSPSHERRRALLPALLLAAMPFMAQALDIGATAPPIALPDASGQILKLEPGKVRWVDFWASWCGPCRHSFPWLNEMATKYGPQGLDVLGVNLDTEADEAAQFLAKLPAKFPVVYDPQGTTPPLYNVRGMPTSVLIGRDGKVAYQHIGFTDPSRETLESEIRKALEAKP